MRYSSSSAVSPTTPRHSPRRRRGNVRDAETIETRTGGEGPPRTRTEYFWATVNAILFSSRPSDRNIIVNIYYNVIILYIFCSVSLKTALYRYLPEACPRVRATVFNIYIYKFFG